MSNNPIDDLPSADELAQSGLSAPVQGAALAIKAALVPLTTSDAHYQNANAAAMTLSELIAQLRAISA